MPKIVEPVVSSVCYLGIDPGKSGGLAIVKDKKVIDYWEMPPSVLDLWHVFLTIDKKYAPAHCYLEQVQSMPNEGHKGAFTFGMNFGRLQAFLAAIGFPHSQVTPQAWQKQMLIVSKKKTETRPQFKERLRVKAQQLFPDVPLWNQPRTVGKQRAICDAILLAESCRRAQEFNKGN